MTFRLPAIFMLTLALTGCASYVNIPPDSNEDIAINAINAPPTPGLIAAALDYVLIIRPAPQKPYAIRLPVEAGESTWGKVLANRDGAMAWSQSAPAVPVYDVRSIRIRGSDAWVDVVVPQAADGRPLAEVRLEGNVMGWKVTSVRHWSAGVIRQRESSGQYGPTSSSVPMMELTYPDSGSPAVNNQSTKESKALDDAIEQPSSASPDRRTLTPIRPVKPDDGG